MFLHAVEAVDPSLTLPRYLPESPTGKTIVVGAGKSSAVMAQAFERAWIGAGHKIDQGLVVTRTGYGVPCDQIEIVEARHPVPDAAGAAAAARIRDLLLPLSAQDLVIALISGGGSALLSLPPDPISAADKQRLNQVLLRSGASIHEMNCIRKHVSQVKGGRLALAAHPAPVLSYILSDIPGDDPALVASGPTLADRTTREDALGLIARYGMEMPDSVMAWMRSPASAAPHPEDPSFARDRHVVLAAAQIALEAAADKARALGLSVHILSDAMEGEAKDLGATHAALARQIKTRGQPFQAPCLLLSGGECTVTLPPDGAGRGGPNAEFLLGFALAAKGLEGVTAIACDTDGTDGTEDNAGAMADGQTVARLYAAGQDPYALLAAHVSYGAFQALGDLVITGPTVTNVNDFRAVLIT
ncbi:MAG: glycerate kinase type-2 family protein [Rhodospirillaceae bacterium]